MRVCILDTIPINRNEGLLMNESQGFDPMFRENNASWMDGFASDPLNVYAAKTFGWMFVGLLVTFATGMAFAFGGGLYYLLALGMPAVFALMIAEIVVVMVLSARLHSLSIGAARGLFFAYAVLNGVTFSAIFFAYDVQILLTVFALTALYFGVLAAYGWITKRDLSGLRPILTAGLVFLLVFWVVSIFLPMSSFERLICLIGLAVFMGLTAYDTQKIKQLHTAFAGNYEMAKKASIFAALQLYLDFINIFLYILRLVGGRRSD